jgi:O-6-methylguanine DNA methyltransferase
MTNCFLELAGREGSFVIIKTNSFLNTFPSKWQNFSICVLKIGRVTNVNICPEVLNSNKDFSQKVLLTLKNEVKFGETITRQNLARLSGNPKGAQAAGSAVSDNPIHFVIPSHRVIKRDGSIGNYNKVTEIGITEWLLDFEKPTKGLEKKTEETSDTSDEE